MARRRRRSLGERPTGGRRPLATALTWLGGGAVVGAGLGALAYPTNRAGGALLGAESGLALVGVGGLVVGVVSSAKRTPGFYTAAIGLGGLALLGLATSIVAPQLMVGNTGTAGVAGLPGTGAIPGLAQAQPILRMLPHAAAHR